MNQLEFYVEGQRVDLFDLHNNPIKLNYILLDLQFLEKRGGTVSNIFKIPATQNNNRIFGYYNDQQQRGAENFIKARKGQLFAGGITVFDGQVTGKAYYCDSGPASYETMLKTNNLDWSDFLKELKLVDLTLPAPNYDEATVRSSWGHTYTDKYVAPLVCYGKPYNYNITWNTTTLLYEPHHTGGNPLQWFYDDFRYWLFAWPMIEEMFAMAGYKIESNFINNPTATFDFKKLIVYFNDDNAYTDLPASVNFKEGRLISNDRNCLDLLKGIANLFHLIFYTDTVKRIVYIEPFDDFFSGEAGLDDKIDLAQTSKITQYSDVLKNIIYNLKEDSFGASYQQFVKNSYFPSGFWTGNTDLLLDAGFYKGGFRLTSGGEETVNESYFKGYLTGKIQVDSDFSIYMPFLLDGQVSEVVTTGYLGFKQAWHPLPAQADTSDPCFAYYAGMTNMISGTDLTSTKTRFRYHGDAARSDRPFAYICDYAGEEHGNNFHFADQWNSISMEMLQRVGITPPVAPFLRPGLINKYFKNFLYSIYYGRYAEVPALIKPIDLLTGIQRKRIRLFHTVWALLEISNYNPAVSGTTLCKLLEYTVADSAFTANLVYGGDYSVLYDF